MLVSQRKTMTARLFAASALISVGLALTARSTMGGSVAHAADITAAQAGSQAYPRVAAQMAALPPQTPITGRNGVLPLGAQNGARADISALRYYAVRGEQERVNAEIRRLKTLYPGWKQPANIFAAEDGVERELWSLYSKGKIDEVKARIAKLSKTVPGYVPSMDLVSKLEQREYRSDLAKAWTNRQWDKVIDLANTNPDLMLGDDVEVIWFVGEAYAQLERPQAAYDSFAAALAVSKSDQERTGTIQRASQLLSTEASLRLLESNAELTTQNPAKGEAQDAVLRGALARSAEFGEGLSANLSTRMDAFAKRAVDAKSFPDSVLFAWSHFGQSNWAQARNWFHRALQFGSQPQEDAKGHQQAMAKAMEGLIMSHMRAGEAQQAAKLARSNVEASPEIAGLYISTHAPMLLNSRAKVLPKQDLSLFAAKTVGLQNGEGAEALAWYAYNLKQQKVASAWFSKAIEWEETETAAFGLTLASVAVKDKASFDYLQNRFGVKYERVAKVKFQQPRAKRVAKIVRKSPKANAKGSLRARIAKAYKAKRYSQCLQLSRKLRTYGPLVGSDHQMRGWCLLDTKRPAEAEQAFASAVRLGGKGLRESAYGQALAALRSGKTNMALDIAESYALTGKQRRTVDVELLTQRARAAFANQDYAASVYALDERAKMVRETRDLTFLRGWAHFHAGHYQNAKSIFAVLDQQLSTRDTTRGLNAAKQKLAFVPNRDN
ncbi:MAG: hypothetical protein AAGI12_05690 [Pseudomonadota bacterium]